MIKAALSQGKERHWFRHGSCETDCCLAETYIRQQSPSPRIVRRALEAARQVGKPWSGATSAYVINQRRSVCANTESKVKEQGKDLSLRKDRLCIICQVEEESRFHSFAMGDLWRALTRAQICYDLSPKVFYLPVSHGAVLQRTRWVT